MITDRYYLLACHDCGVKVDRSDQLYSLSTLWVVEYEDTMLELNHIFFVCADCTAFYRQSPDCRIAPLSSYNRIVDTPRLADLVINGGEDHEVCGIIGRYMWEVADKERRARRVAPAAPAAPRPQAAKPTRAPRPGSRRPLPPGLRYSVLERDGFRCCTCGRSPAAHGVVLHVDHIVAVVKGGTNDPGNLRALCAECNLGKSDR